MQTRRDQVQAHRFTVRRLVSAMLVGDPEAPEHPMRRVGLSIFASAMIGTIILTAVGVIGLVTGRGGSIEPNTLIIDKDTGAKFVYVDYTGEPTLHPVLNYASARLILGQPEPQERVVAQSKLRGLKRGVPLGIRDAPDDLPRRDAMVGLPWSVCHVPRVGQAPQSRVVIGRAIPGGELLGANDALLVASGETRYLIMNGLRLKITEEVAYPTLGLTAPPIRVSPQFLNAIPAGPDLNVFGVPGAGQPLHDRTVAGETPVIGWIYRDENNAYYLMTRDGLVKIGEVYGRLRLARDNRDRTEPLPPHAVSSTEVARHLVAGRSVEPPGYPTQMPVLRNDPLGADVPVCATYADGPTGAQLSVEIHRTATADLDVSAPSAMPVRPTGRDSGPLAHDVIIPGGRAAIVRPVPAPGATLQGTTVYLITDQGVKYPLGTGDVDAQSALGYGELRPVAVPADMLTLLPTGPALTGEAARQAVETPSPSSPA